MVATNSGARGQRMETIRREEKSCEKSILENALTRSSVSGIVVYIAVGRIVARASGRRCITYRTCELNMLYIPGIRVYQEQQQQRLGVLTG